MKDLRVVIADDEPNVLLLTQMLFKEMGMTVETATDGQEAVDKIFQNPPDLIITDVIMPHKTGFEICKEVRSQAETENIPIIILSALGDEYNKITGFEGGADDYITKPFNIDELKARAKTLLLRSKARGPVAQLEEPAPDASPAQDVETLQETYAEGLDIEQIPSGLSNLDASLFGGFAKGSNILCIGKLGAGKSEFGRKFMNEGLANGERCLFVALDDNPQQIRKQMEFEGQHKLTQSLSDYENSNMVRFVDAYSWSTGNSEEQYAVSGALELNSLAGIISDAGYDLGQTVQHKLGGRRVIDSLSSLLIDFDLSQVIRFINQVARTALSFGNVTTLFIIEEGTVSEQVLNNIKYVMDGVVELEKNADGFYARVVTMKWAKFSDEWKPQ